MLALNYRNKIPKPGYNEIIMKHFAPMNNEELRKRFNPEGSLLRRQQMRMLEILLEVDKICQKHQIPYWLSSGTLIGAMRHDGFIPWDDDLDIEMMRDDYLRLMASLPRVLDVQLLCRRVRRVHLDRTRSADFSLRL